MVNCTTEFPLNVTCPVGSFSFARRQDYRLVLPPEEYPLHSVLQHFSKEIILYIAEFGYSSRPKRFISMSKAKHLDKHLATNLLLKYTH